MKRIVVVTAIAFLGASLGCSATVDGKVDGQSVPALFSAFFVQRHTKVPDPANPGGPPLVLSSVAGTGVSLFDGCNGAQKRQKAVNDAFDTQTKALRAAANADDTNAANEAFTDAVVAYDAQNLPSDFWTVSVVFSAFSDADLPNGKADIDFKGDPPTTPPTTIGSVSVCRTDDFPEKKKNKDGTVELKSHVSCFNAATGSVEVKQYTTDKTLQITADVDLSRDDLFPDDDAGAATINISGGWCEELEKSLDDNDRLVEDRNAPPTG